MQSKRKVLLALTINKHYFIRGVVRYAREHDWYLVTDMMYTGRVPLGWRGDGILTILGYRKELADFKNSAGVPAVATTLVNDKISLPHVEGDNVKIGQLAAEHFLERYRLRLPVGRKPKGVADVSGPNSSRVHLEQPPPLGHARTTRKSKIL